MKRFLIASLGAMMCVAANASDGGLFYEETENINTNVSVTYDVVEYYVPAAPVVKPQPKPAPCARARLAGEPVRVKTHSEVIDHYQVYQPVTVYEPVGTYAERRVVKQPTCNRCK